MSSSKKRNTFFSSSSKEDFWVCVLLIVLIVGIAVAIVFSQQNANEKYKQSDYFLETNNILYQVQQEKGMAVLVSVKSKFLRGNNASSLRLFPDMY
jgi:hypothetical protein